MDEVKEKIQKALGEYGIIGLIIALAISVILTIVGWVLSLFAGRTDNEAAKIRKEAISFHDDELKSLNTILEKLGDEKIEAIETFDRFISAFESIKNRPEGLATKFEKIKIPKLEIEEMKKMKARTQALLAQGGGAVGGLGLGLAVFGVNAIALAPAALVGGVAICLKGASLKTKATKNKKEAIKLREEVYKIVDYYKNLGRISNDLFGCFVLVKHQYYEYLDKFCALVESNSNWKSYSADDKTVIKNTVLLVKLVNDLCNVNLVNKPKSVNNIETVNEKEASLVIERSKEILSTV